ncbi:MAG: aminotransferase class III-fold pyridoxal phosphate-dependent enzyme [Phycisphaerales bacterium]
MKQPYDVADPIARPFYLIGIAAMPVDMREQSSSLNAAGLREDAEIARAIETILTRVQAAQADIDQIRPATAAGREQLQHWLDRQAQVKGKPAWYPYVGSGLGNGPFVELMDGSVKLDLINGIGVSMFGHSDPDLIETAIRAAISDTTMQGNLQFNSDAIEFGEFLLEEAVRTSRLKHAFIINSGALANETALKICMQKKDGKAPRIIAFNDCFMGRTTTMCQIGDSAAGRDGIPLNTFVDYMPFYDHELGEDSIAVACNRLRDMIARYPGQHACFAMELIQGEGGYNTAPREFFVALMELCREHDIPVWLDEIQTFGRTTAMFHFDALNLGEYVDVVTVGKITQVCACLYTEELNPKPGLLSATFIGSSVALQVGRRMLERLRDGGHYGKTGHNQQLFDAFSECIKDVRSQHPEWFGSVLHPATSQPLQKAKHIGGAGGMMRFTPFGGVKKKIIDATHALFDEGIICFSCGHGPYHIRFLPPIGVMQPRHFKEVAQPIIERALARVHAAG